MHIVGQTSLMQNNKGRNVIVDLTFEFSVGIIRYTTLLEQQKRFILARQLLRSATSIGANVREAQNAESRIDFIHKMKLSAKEADETEYWLLLCDSIEEFPDCKQLLADCSAIIKILARIISTAKRALTAKGI